MANNTHTVPVPMEQWGKDHWSTLAYIETCCVDNDGKLSLAKMRPDFRRHPLFVSAVQSMSWNNQKYPTLLKEGELENHDDWDCLYDMVLLGLVEFTDVRIGRVEGGNIIVQPQEIPEYFDIPSGKRGPIRTPTGRFGDSRRTIVKVRLTEKGIDYAAKLRAHKANGGSFATFTPE